MQRSQSHKYQKERSRIEEILSKSGGQIQTSVTALRDLERRIDEDTKVEKSPKGKMEPRFPLREREREREGKGE